MSDIDSIIAVPEEIEAAIKHWACDEMDEDAVRTAWLAIGEAVKEHVTSQVAEALRIERGGCTFCPAPAGGAHRFDCRRPGAGSIAIDTGWFKP